MQASEGYSEQTISIRPLVRYVDESQAVVDICITVRGPRRGQPAKPLEIHVQLIGPDGCAYEHKAQVTVKQGCGTTRFEMGAPSRWWPSGMGDQSLYDLSVSIISRDDMIDQWDNTIGLTSVRPMRGNPDAVMVSFSEDDQPVLLINGQECEIRAVVPVDPADERHVLPVGEHCLLVVRDHYGPDLLYNAADRAGTLLVQSIPFLDHMGAKWTQRSVGAEVDRLAGHPSLAGWLVEQADKAGDRIAAHLQELDPTRSVFRSVPMA